MKIEFEKTDEGLDLYVRMKGFCDIFSCYDWELWYSISSQVEELLETFSTERFIVTTPYVNNRHELHVKKGNDYVFLCRDWDAGHTDVATLTELLEQTGCKDV